MPYTNTKTEVSCRKAILCLWENICSRSISVYYPKFIRAVRSIHSHVFRNMTLHFHSQNSGLSETNNCSQRKQTLVLTNTTWCFQSQNRAFSKHPRAFMHFERTSPCHAVFFTGKNLSFQKRAAVCCRDSFVHFEQYNYKRTFQNHANDKRRFTKHSNNMF